jgi:serine/threonine-protein kinase
MRRAKALCVASALPGQRISRYRLIERLGQGSQAEVWKAIRLEPNPEVVVLKLLAPVVARDPGRRDQVRREAELGTRLASLALLPTLDFGECNGVLYLAMPMGTVARSARPSS